MIVSVEVPERLVDRIAPVGQDLARTVLEAIALEGYRSDRLTEFEIRELLGFETRMEVHGFLKEHGVFLHYTGEDLQHDLDMAHEIAQGASTRRHTHSLSDRLVG